MSDLAQDPPRKPRRRPKVGRRISIGERWIKQMRFWIQKGMKDFPSGAAWLGAGTAILGAFIVYIDTIQAAAGQWSDLSSLGTREAIQDFISQADDLFYASITGAVLALAVALAQAGFFLFPDPDKRIAFGVVLSISTPVAATVLSYFFVTEQQWHMSPLSLLGAGVILFGMLVPYVLPRLAPRARAKSRGSKSGESETAEDDTKPQESKKVRSWLRDRTPMEYWLSAACLLLLALVVVLLSALSAKTAPFATDWGTLADWVGVGVTAGGFLAACITLHLKLRDRAAAATAQKRIMDAKAEKERRKWAEAFQVRATAIHHRTTSGHYSDANNTVELQCEAQAKSGRYTDVVFYIPKLDGKYTNSWDRPLTGNVPGKPLGWKLVGPALFNRNNPKATEWLEKQVYVDFTDPRNQRWRKYGNGVLEENPDPSAEDRPELSA